MDIPSQQKAETTPSLPTLPWGLRRLVIEVLKQGRERDPFSSDVIADRVRIRNCFASELPEVTDVYFPRQRHRHLHGHALRAASRQLRHETDAVTEEELRSGRVRSRLCWIS